MIVILVIKIKTSFRIEFIIPLPIKKEIIYLNFLQISNQEIYLWHLRLDHLNMT